MGYNTVAVLYNDHGYRIKDRAPDINEAMSRKSITGDGDFGYGEIISCQHADCDQVIIVGQNSGRLLTYREGNRQDFDILANLLRERGYSVKAPEDKRAKPPHKWNRNNWFSGS